MRIWARGLGAFDTNCYIIACPDTGACAVIDPDTPDPWITEILAEHGLHPSLIILTHGHLDHIGGVEWVKGFSKAPVLIHPADQPMLTDPRRNGSASFGQPITAGPADRFIQEGESIALGHLQLQVLDTPGHTPGGICLYTPGHLIAGDTLFAGSIGRTDLVGGDFEALIRSIREKLFVLPDDTVVYPGHGPTTTIGEEKEYNPFV